MAGIPDGAGRVSRGWDTVNVLGGWYLYTVGYPRAIGVPRRPTSMETSINEN